MSPKLPSSWEILGIGAAGLAGRPACGTADILSLSSQDLPEQAVEEGRKERGQGKKGKEGGKDSYKVKRWPMHPTYIAPINLQEKEHLLVYFVL